MQTRQSALRNRNQLANGLSDSIGSSRKYPQKKFQNNYCGQHLKIDSKNFVAKINYPFSQDYDIIEQIGEGSFGKVYKIYHRTLKLFRALKKIKKDQSHSLFSSFQEIDVLKQLDHQNILKIYQFYETNEYSFIVTEIFEGKDLFDEIDEQNQLNEKIGSMIIRQVLLALRYTRCLGIAHRDIKPENILIKNLGFPQKMKIKIIDWGLGALVENKKINRVCGTPQYAAPEIFKGRYSTQCDMWSLGVLMYVLLTGLMPFKGQCLQDTIKIVKQGKFDKNVLQFRRLSPDAQDLILRLLQKCPQNRLTPEQALKHSWIQKFTKPIEIPLKLNETLKRLKQFSMKNIFGLAVIDFINNHYSTSKQKQRLDEVFRYLDQNGDGCISQDQLRNGYKNLYGAQQAEKIARQTFKKLDMNENGKLQYSQFIAFGLKIKKKQLKDRLEGAFKLLDKDKNGLISCQQIGSILQGKTNENNLRKILSDFDENDDQQIDYNQFEQYLKKHVKY